jgi:hypothetical protein
MPHGIALPPLAGPTREVPMNILATSSRGTRFDVRVASLATSLCAGVAVADDLPAGDLIDEDQIPMGNQVDRTYAPSVAVEYSNVTLFTGQGFAHGGTVLQGTNRITRLVADDLTPTGINAGNSVTQIKFSVANFNAVNVSVRARVRFWFDAAGVPGAYYNIPADVGFSFNPLSYAPGVTVVTGNIPAGTFAMPGAKFWAGITFDDNSGTTGATTAQMDNLGQGLFNPPTVGSSSDIAFRTNAAGSFFPTSNPAGVTFNFGGQPVTNFGWEFSAATPVPVTRATWGRIKSLYR